MEISKTLLDKVVNDSVEHSDLSAIAVTRVVSAASNSTSINDLLTTNSGDRLKTHLDLMGLSNNNTNHPSYNNLVYKQRYNVYAQNYKLTKLNIDITFNTEILKPIGGFTTFVSANPRKKNSYLCNVALDGKNVSISLSNGEKRSKFAISNVEGFFTSKNYLSDNTYGLGSLQNPIYFREYIVQDVKFLSSSTI